jgi:hypothetical protein
MTISMYQASVPLFERNLGALAGILAKAAAWAESRKIQPDVLLNARLSPDMFPLLRQVQITCDFAKNTCARLAGAEPAKIEDNEKSFADLQARVARTLELVRACKAAQVDGSEDRDIRLTIGGQPMEFKGLPYLTGFALPNFFFHYSMTYAILRHNGLEIGKRDFIPG